MIEAMTAVVILAFAASGIMLPLTTGATLKAESHKQVIALQLGSSLMEEIICCDYDNIISTYNGYYEAPGTINDLGYTYDDLYGRNFSRNSSCSLKTIEDCEMIEVTVKVYYKTNCIIELKRLIGKK